MAVDASGIAAVFPGQGSQRSGMGRDFFDACAAARAAYEEASDALGLDLTAICFGDDERLHRTEYTQPAILVTEIAMLRALEAEMGLRPAWYGGHSLGEYTALCAAGAIPLATAAVLVRQRGALMQQAAPIGSGAMAAVTADGVADRDMSEHFAGLEVDVANRNSPDQIVVSGPAAAVAQASERLAAALDGVTITPLEVSAPFHSWMMRSIEPAFRAALEERAPRFSPAAATRVTCNVTGGFHTADPAALIDNLTRQISGTVDWIANMQALAGAASTVYEVGPNRPLRRFFQSAGVEARSIVTLRAARKELQS